MKKIIALALTLMIISTVAVSALAVEQQHSHSYKTVRTEILNPDYVQYVERIRRTYPYHEYKEIYEVHYWKERVYQICEDSSCRQTTYFDRLVVISSKHVRTIKIR